VKARAADPPPGAPIAASDPRSGSLLASALVITLATQSIASVTLLAPTVVIPVAASDLGVPPASIGLFMTAAYVVAIAAGLVTPGFIRRHGPVRLCQAACVLLAAGLLAGATGHLAMVPLMVLLIGIPYGVVNPVSSQLLARHAPPRAMAMVFSIKQCGVPLGGLLAGAAIPPLLLVSRWEWTFAAIAIGCLVAAVLFQPARSRFDADRDPDAPIRWSGAGGAVAVAWREPRLRELSIGSATYSFVQTSIVTFIVSYLHLELGLSLVAAGLAASAAHVSGVAGRIAWGAVADRVRRPRLILGIVCLLVACLCLAFAALPPAPDRWLVTLVAAITGFTALGWNGVAYAEVARAAPRGDVSLATGGTQFFTFGGALAGPLACSILVGATGRYAPAIALLSLPIALVGVRYLMRAPAGAA